MKKLKKNIVLLAILSFSALEINAMKEQPQPTPFQKQNEVNYIETNIPQEEKKEVDNPQNEEENSTAAKPVLDPNKKKKKKKKKKKNENYENENFENENKIILNENNAGPLVNMLNQSSAKLPINMNMIEKPSNTYENIKQVEQCEKAEKEKFKKFKSTLIKSFTKIGDIINGLGYRYGFKNAPTYADREKHFNETIKDENNKLMKKLEWFFIDYNVNLAYLFQEMKNKGVLSELSNLIKELISNIKYISLYTRKFINSKVKIGELSIVKDMLKKIQNYDEEKLKNKNMPSLNLLQNKKKFAENTVELLEIFSKIENIEECSEFTEERVKELNALRSRINELFFLSKNLVSEIEKEEPYYFGGSKDISKKDKQQKSLPQLIEISKQFEKDIENAFYTETSLLRFLFLDNFELYEKTKQIENFDNKFRALLKKEYDLTKHMMECVGIKEDLPKIYEEKDPISKISKENYNTAVVQFYLNDINETEEAKMNFNKNIKNYKGNTKSTKFEIKEENFKDENTKFFIKILNEARKIEDKGYKEKENLEQKYKDVKERKAKENQIKREIFHLRNLAESLSDIKKYIQNFNNEIQNIRAAQKITQILEEIDSKKNKNKNLLDTKTEKEIFDILISIKAKLFDKMISISSIPTCLDPKGDQEKLKDPNIIISDNLEMCTKPLEIPEIFPNFYGFNKVIPSDYEYVLNNYENYNLLYKNFGSTIKEAHDYYIQKTNDYIKSKNLNGSKIRIRLNDLEKFKYTMINEIIPTINGVNGITKKCYTEILEYAKNSILITLKKLILISNNITEEIEDNKNEICEQCINEISDLTAKYIFHLYNELNMQYTNYFKNSYNEEILKELSASFKSKIYETFKEGFDNFFSNIFIEKIKPLTMNNYSLKEKEEDHDCTDISCKINYLFKKIIDNLIN